MTDASLAPVTKICIKCNQEKPLSEFHKRSKESGELKGNCKDCAREATRVWYINNKDRAREQKRSYTASNPRQRVETEDQKAARREKSRIYRQNNKEKIIEQRKIYYERNKESCKKRSASNRIANIEKYLERERQYRSTRRQYIYVKEKEAERYQRNKEAIRVRCQTPEYRAKRNKYKAENRDKFRIHDRIRHARKRSSDGRYTSQEIRNLHEKQLYKCANCKASIKKEYHIDHITPLAKGGSNYIENIQLLCPACNLRKNARCPFEWANMNGRLL